MNIKKNLNIYTKGFNGPVIETKENEICYYEELSSFDSYGLPPNNGNIYFYDLFKKKSY